MGSQAVIYGLAIVSAACAVFWEYWVRSHPGVNFWRLYIVAIPSQIMIAYTMLRLVTSEGIIGATVIFTFTTNLLRILIVWFVIRESVSSGALIAFALIIAANFIKFLWR